MDDNNITAQLVDELRKRLGKPTAIARSKAISSHRNVSDSFDALRVASASVAADREAARLREKIRQLEAHLQEQLNRGAATPISVSAIVTPQRKTTEGILIKSTSLVWGAIIEQLGADWSFAYRIPAHQWEEIVAGAFDKAGFDEVILTPRSGDHGRDVIALRHGVGSIKIIGSVKAYKPGHLVGYDDIRALIGVMTGERDTSKGILATTSDFPPNVMSDPFISPFMPYRLELMNGLQLKEWLVGLLRETDQS